MPKYMVQIRETPSGHFELNQLIQEGKSFKPTGNRIPIPGDDDGKLARAIRHGLNEDFLYFRER